VAVYQRGDVTETATALPDRVLLMPSRQTFDVAATDLFVRDGALFAKTETGFRLLVDDVKPVSWSSIQPAHHRPQDKNPTVLQQHVLFFDHNKDWKITLVETYLGLRYLGLDPVSSSFFAGVINGALGWPTSGYPTTTIDVHNIANAKHGSDTDVYDEQGNFVPAKFDALFANWDKNKDNALDLGELAQRTWDQADLFDVIGLIASGGEFGLLWVIANENGKISRKRMRGLYDGSLFYEIAASR
jgi:peroxygenase